MTRRLRHGIDGGMDGGRDAALRARSRAAAATIILAFVGWVAANWIGAAAGLPFQLAFAVDLLCLGALGWALVTLLGIRRARRDEGL